MKKLLILLAIVCSAVIVRAGEYPDISITELKTAIKDKSAVIIDVNGSDSYKAGHIPGRQRWPRFFPLTRTRWWSLIAAARSAMLTPPPRRPRRRSATPT